MKMKTGGGCATKKTMKGGAKKQMKGGAKKQMKGGAKKQMKGGDSGVAAPATHAGMPAAPAAAAPAAPAMPAAAVPKPTMAAQAGGAKKSKKSKSVSGVVMGYCMKCETRHEMKNPVEYVAKNGRKMVKGTCAKNGNGMNAIVGN